MSQILRLLHNLPHKVLLLLHWTYFYENHQQPQPENNNLVYKNYKYFHFNDFPCYEIKSKFPIGHIHLERLKSKVFLAINSTASHWSTKPAPNSAKHFKDLNSKTSRGTEKALTAQKNTWTADMESYVFKYGAVRNTVSSSKSQANATYSAIDEGDV